MNTIYAKYAILYNFSYMAIGALTPLIGQYLDHIGFSGTQIGTITAAGTTVAILATTFWGSVYNRSDHKHAILSVLCLMAAIICFVITGVKSYYIFIFVFGIMYFFQAPVMSLTDAFTVERMKTFGDLRAWGAVGFALGVFIAGRTAEKLGIESIFFFYIVSFIIAAITIQVIKRREIDSEKSGKSISNVQKADEKTTKEKGYLKLLQDKKIRQLIICAFFMGGTNVANNTYFSFLYLDGGGTIAGVGAAMLLMVGSEVPVMAWCEKLAAKFTMEKTILAAMIISVVRFAVYGLGVPWWVLICMSFTQGIVNGILLVEFVRYIAKIASPDKRSLAISAYYIIGSNFSTIICQLIGGLLLETLGAYAVYMFFAAFNLMGVFFYVKFRLYTVKHTIYLGEK